MEGDSSEERRGRKGNAPADVGQTAIMAAIAANAARGYIVLIVVVVEL